jgi:DNA-binding Xre family transcriptional regulator
VTKTKPFAQLSAPILADPVRRARIEQHTRAILDALDLADLRASRQVTQQDLADQLAISQANVSRIEHGDDLYLSTLANYVAALGGRLELTAVFPEGSVSIAVPGAVPSADLDATMPLPRER